MIFYHQTKYFEANTFSYFLPHHFEAKQTYFHMDKMTLVQGHINHCAPQRQKYVFSTPKKLLLLNSDGDTHYLMELFLPYNLVRINNIKKS